MPVEIRHIGTEQKAFEIRHFVEIKILQRKEVRILVLKLTLPRTLGFIQSTITSLLSLGVPLPFLGCTPSLSTRAPPPPRLELSPTLFINSLLVQTDGDGFRPQRCIVTKAPSDCYSLTRTVTTTICPDLCHN